MISIIVPTKDEPYINELIADIHNTVKEIHEVIVVDKSQTPPILNEAKLILQKSNGLGNAFLEGLPHAMGDIIVFMDGDGSHDPRYINEMRKFLDEHDIVIGSKYVGGGFTEDYRTRVFISKILNKIISMFLELKIKDLMSGYAMVRKETLENIELRPRGYKILLEIVFKSKARVKEIPIRFYKRKLGKSKVGMNLVGLKELINIFILVYELKFNKDI